MTGKDKDPELDFDQAAFDRLKWYLDSQMFTGCPPPHNPIRAWVYLDFETGQPTHIYYDDFGIIAKNLNIVL